MPVVAQTVAAFFERPIAKALGIDVSTTATLGLGRSAWTQRRSIIACSSRRLLRRDDVRAVGAQRELVGGEELEEEQPADDDEQRGLVGGDHDGDEHDVDGAEEEHRQQHPRLEPGVAAEGGGSSHGASHLAKRAFDPCQPIGGTSELHVRPLVTVRRTAILLLCAGNPSARVRAQLPMPSGRLRRRPPSRPPAAIQIEDRRSGSDRRPRRAPSGCSRRDLELDRADRRPAAPLRSASEAQTEREPSAQLEATQVDLRAERARLVRLRARLLVVRAGAGHAAASSSTRPSSPTW